MSFSFTADRGHGLNASVDTFLDVVPTATIPAGAVLLVRIAAHNAAGVQGASSEHSSISDTQGNTYTKLGEETRSSTASADDGSTVSLWLCQVAVQLTTSDTVTAQFAAGTQYKTISLAEYAVAPGSNVVLKGVGRAHGSSTTPGVSVSGIASGAYLFVAAVGFRRWAVDALTYDANYTTDITAFDTVAGGASTREKQWGEYRLLTATGDSYAASLAGSSSEWAALLAVLEETPAGALAGTAAGSTTCTATGRSLGAIAGIAQGGCIVDGALGTQYRGNGTLAMFGDLGSTVLEASPSASFVAMTTGETVPAGALIIVRVGSDDVAGVDGPSSGGHLLSDSTGRTWVKLSEVSRLDDTGGFRTGVTLSMWMLVVGAELPAGTVITATLAAPALARTIGANWYDLGVDYVLNYLGVAANAGSGTPGSSPRTVTLVLADSGLYTWFGTGGWDSGRATVPIVTTGWTEDRAPILEGSPGRANGVEVFGQMRQFEAGTQTWLINEPGSEARRWAAILAAFVVEEGAPPPPPPPVPGVRQYEPDFESLDYGLDQASTTRRPDAISLDYLTAFCTGPRAIEEPIAGVSALLWRGKEIGNAVTFEPANLGNNAWEAPIEVLTYSGPAFVEIDIAFDALGHPCIVGERPTGQFGQPEVWRYSWNTGLADYEFVKVGPGRTPRVILDFMGGCGPPPTIQLFYLRVNVGMVRLNSDDDFVVEDPTPLGYNRRYFLEEACVTTDQRVTVVYGVHDEAAGTYLLQRLDSVSYAPSLPIFFGDEGNVDDIYWTQGGMYVEPADSTDTETVTLRVAVVEGVDAIELECRAEFPEGFEPTFDEQVQEYAPLGGIPALGAHIFNLTVSHGQGGMTPNAFRARTRTTVNGRVCYSAWRYHLSAPQDPVTPDIVMGLVGCDRAMLVCPPADEVPDGTIFQVSRWGLPPDLTDCPDSVPSAVLPCFVEGGHFTLGGWQQDFQVAARTRTGINFTDETGAVFGFQLYGAVFYSLQSGAGGPSPIDPNMDPRQFP